MTKAGPIFCPGPVGRRDFLRGGFLGLTGLGLGDLLRARAQAADVNRSAKPETACIFIWLGGGPSQFETYDMKPDSPAEYRGEFRPIQTSVPGIEICEHLPMQARVADRFSLIRSCSHVSGNHENGTQHFLTGRKANRDADKSSMHPDIGAVFKRLNPVSRQAVPNYVSVHCNGFEYGGTGYLGQACMPFRVCTDKGDNPTEQWTNWGVGAFRVGNDKELALLRERSNLRDSFDRLRRELNTDGLMAAMDGYDQEALRMLTGDQAQRAFEVWREPEQVRERYGRTRAGQEFLLARRLVEHGVGFVTVDFRNVEGALAHTWDDHATGWNIFEQMRLRLPVYDQALSALIEDLFARGLDQRVLVVACGEFGRTPRISVSEGRPGRDHYPATMSILVSGGGLRMGQVVGSTSLKGEEPKDRPLTPADFLSTVYKFLGINPRHEFLDRAGRPLPILPDGEPIGELLG